MADEAVDPDAEQCRGDDPPQPAQRQHLAEHDREQDCGADRQGMSEGERTQRAP